MGLKEYIKKRRFVRTPEPKGKISELNTAPIFVVQKHRAKTLHYDFRLEMDGVLKSWAVPKGPSMNPADKRLAMHVEDHPLEYKDFEGRIPEGEYGAGNVEIWDKGKVQFINKELAGGHLTFILDGKKLKGEFVLVKIARPKSRSGEPWLLIKAQKDSLPKNINKQERADR